MINYLSGRIYLGSMDKKSKIFFGLFAIVILAIAAISYYKYFILRDYHIVAQAECDPTKEVCFVSTCNINEDESCPQKESDRQSYYKLVEKKAYNIPECNDELICAPLKCAANEDCKEIFCTSGILENGEFCSNPHQYNLEHVLPAVENASTTDNNI